MPRERKSKPELFQSWFDGDPEAYKDMQIRGNDLYCTVCDRIINTSTKTKVTRHLNSHARAEDSVFYHELTETLLASNIPFYKLQNPTLRRFLEKYTNRNIPNETTLRQGYVNQIYNKVLESIREDIADSFVYFIVDETTDPIGRSVVSFLIGALKSDSASDSHLLATKVMVEISYETIVTLVTECFNILWPNRDAADKVLVMLSDATACMLKAGDILSQKYTKMVHFTCVVHTLNRVVDEIRNSFPLINNFILNMNKIFMKPSTRRNVFKDDIPLPPKVVVSKRNTWLEVVAYYDTYFGGIKEVICRFNSKDNSVVRKLQNLLKNQSVHDDISYINRRYGLLVSAIKKLETRKLGLNEQFQVLETVTKRIYADDGHPVSIAVKNKLQSMLQKNPGYEILENVWKVLDGTSSDLPPNLLNYSSRLKDFSYCPLSTVDVQLSFSLYESVSSNKQRCFAPQTLEKHVIICFKYSEKDTETKYY